MPKETPKFEIQPIDDIPKREYKKGSKYDPVLTAFIERKVPLAKIVMEGLDADYINRRLTICIERRELTDKYDAVTVNHECYLKVLEEK